MTRKTLLFAVIILLSFSIHFVTTIDCLRSTKPINDCFTYCRIQYRGNNNFYNSTSELCELTPSCTEEEEYDISKNKCIPIGSSIDDEIGNITLNNTNPGEDNNELKPPKIKCVNGFYPTNSTLCLCYPGWISEENNSTAETEIVKCSIATDYNSTNKNPSYDVELSTSNISLILTIVIPIIIGLIISVVLIVCIKKHCSKAKINLESKERPIVIHLSNDATERMKMNNLDNISSINQLGYSTPVKNNNHYQRSNIKQYPKSNTNDLKQSFNHSPLIEKKRQFTYNTPDIKRCGIASKDGHYSIGRNRGYTPKKKDRFCSSDSIKQHHNKLLNLRYIDEDNFECRFDDQRYINNNNYTSPPNKRIKQPVELNHPFSNIKSNQLLNYFNDYPMTHNHFLTNPNWRKNVGNDEEFSNYS